jgi:hypothetical protein
LSRLPHPFDEVLVHCLMFVRFERHGSTSPGLQVLPYLHFKSTPHSSRLDVISKLNVIAITCTRKNFRRSSPRAFVSGFNYVTQIGTEGKQGDTRLSSTYLSNLHTFEVSITLSHALRMATLMHSILSLTISYTPRCRYRLIKFLICR